MGGEEGARSPAGWGAVAGVPPVFWVGCVGLGGAGGVWRCCVFGGGGYVGKGVSAPPRFWSLRCGEEFGLVPLGRWGLQGCAELGEPSRGWGCSREVRTEVVISDPWGCAEIPTGSRPLREPQVDAAGSFQQGLSSTLGVPCDALAPVPQNLSFLVRAERRAAPSSPRPVLLQSACASLAAPPVLARFILAAFPPP